jgi:hypothetical protein
MPEGMHGRKPTAARGRKQVRRSTRSRRAMPTPIAPAAPASAAPSPADRAEAAPHEPTPRELEVLLAAFDPVTHAEPGEVEWRLRRDGRGKFPSERTVIAALRVLRVHASAFELPTAISPTVPQPVAGDWWIWDAHRGADPAFLAPGLGWSFDVISGCSADPGTRCTVPERVPHYLGSRSRNDESRKQLAIRAYHAVEHYRRSVPSRWFRLVAQIMTDPEGQEAPQR